MANLVSEIAEIIDKAEIPKDLKDLLSRIKIESRIDFTDANEVITENVVAADIVRFGAGVKLTIGLPSDRYVVLYAKKLILPGGSEKTEISVAKHSVEVGAPGSKGDKGGQDFHGKEGEEGGRGAEGPRGRPIPTFVLLTDEIEYLIEPKIDRPLHIDAVGSMGGTGGTGGEGGPGGDGRDGIAGFSNI